MAEAEEVAKLPPWTGHEFRRYLTCGILAFGFARARCTDCRQERLVAFSCKGRCVCPSCTHRRMAEVATHLSDSVVPPVPMRQWVLSVPKRLRPHLMRDGELASAVLRILLRVVRSELRVSVRGPLPNDARLGAVSFLHRFGSALNPHPHCARPPFALHRLRPESSRVPLHSPDARLIYELPRPDHDGSTAVRVSPLELLDRLARLIPPPRIHRHRYHGVFAPNAKWRREATRYGRDDVDEPDSGSGSDLSTPASGSACTHGVDRGPRRRWAQLLARVYEVHPLRCPSCHGEMRILAFLTHPAVARPILRHLRIPEHPPPVAPARGPPPAHPPPIRASSRRS